MKLKILLVNPWIYDFAAYNLWARPLGLLKVAEYLSAYDVDLSYIDCTDSFEIKKYGAGRFRSEAVEKPDILKNVPLQYRRYGIAIDEFVERVKAFMPFDMVMITSVMSYWYPGVQEAIKIVREICEDVPIHLGGIYATLYHEHASAHSGADFIYKGPVNKGFDFSLYTFGFRVKRKRARVPYYRLGLYDRYPFAPLLTATGCPFNCPYCASRILSAEYCRRPADDVLREIRELYSIGVRDFAFYDDALLVDPDNNIKPVLRSIVNEKLDARFHVPNGAHARLIDKELAGLMHTANFRTIRLSLETVNADRQRSTGNKVNNFDLEKSVKLLKGQGFTKKEIGIYIMYGLPGQDIEEVQEGINFLKSLNVRINLTEFSPIKDTQSWAELVRKGVINDDIDPLLTNNTFFSYLYSGYNSDRINKIKLDVKGYNSA